MNQIYRLVFNHVAGAWQAVNECARGRGKGGRAATRRARAASARLGGVHRQEAKRSSRPRSAGWLGLGVVLMGLQASGAQAQTFSGTQETSGPFAVGTQYFTDSSTLNASTANAISGGFQYFYDTSALNASAANALSGGRQNFYNISTLNASAANAISGGNQTLYNSSSVLLGANNATTSGAGLVFSNLFGQVGGTLVLNGFSAGIGSINSARTGSGAIVNNGATAAVLTVDGSVRGDSTFSGSIVNTNNAATGTLALVKNGSTTLTLSGANTYTGGTTVQGGTLALGNGGSLSPTGAVALTGSGATFSLADASSPRTIGALSSTLSDTFVQLGDNRLVFGDASDQTFAGTVNGTGSNDIYKQGSGTFTLTGVNNASLIVSAGTVALSGAGTLSATHGVGVGGGATLSISGANGDRSIGGLVGGNANSTVALGNNTLTLNTSTGQQFNGVIEGNGGVVKAGTGTSVFSWQNSYTGGTTVNAGSLHLTGNGSLASTGALAVGSAGVFDITATNGARTVGALSGAANGRLRLGANSLTVDQSVASVFAGSIGSTGGGLVKQGSGTLTLSGTSTYTGGTTVNAGTLAIGNAGTGSVMGDVQVNNTGTLGGTGTIGGNVVVASGATLSPGNSPGTLTIGGNLMLDAGSTTRFELGEAGAVGGASNDLVSVGGNLTLGGDLQATASAAGWYRLFNYGVTDSAATLAGGFANTAVTGSGGFAPASHQLSTTPVAGTTPGQVHLAVLGTGQTMQLWTGANGGNWDGYTPNWVNDAPTGAAASWAGSVAIFGDDAASPGTVAVQGMQFFDTLQFSANGYSVAAASGANAGSLAIAPATGSSARINTAAGISASIAAPLVDGTGDALVKVGSGTLTLSGANTYTGGTTVAEGTLVAASNTALGSGAVTVDNTDLRAATLQVATGVTLGNTIVLNHGGTLVNAGTVARNGVGEIAVQSTAGGATVRNTGGTLSATGTGVRLVNGGSVDNGAGATIEGALAVDGVNGQVVLTNAGTLRGNVRLNATAANQVTLSSGGQLLGDLGMGSDAASRLTLDTPTDQLHSQAVTGSTTFSGELVKTGSATWTLDRDLAPARTTVSAGTLQLGNGGTTGSVGAGPIVNDGTLAVNRSDNLTLANVISGSGKLLKQGGNTLALMGANSYAGGTALKQGRIDVGHSAALGTGELAMDDGTALGFAADGLTIANAIRLTGSNDPVIDTGSFGATMAGAISGGGFITKQGSGTLTLSGANSYTGATEVAQGTLKAGAVNAFSAASVHTVAAGATLDLAGFSQRVAGVTHSGTVRLTGATPGTVLTVTGPWVGNGGTLALGTQLGTDSSPTDKLLLSGAGAVASGSTKVAITNLGGLGGLTTGKGIEVVGTENGASVQGGAFALAAPVVAGAYDYQLNSTSEGAYLTSTSSAPVGPTLYRAEVPLFAALPEQLRQANLAMLGSMHQRIGDKGVSASNSNESGQRQSWGRILTVDRSIAQGGTVSPHSQGRLNGFQAGTDLWATPDWRAGVYVGQLDGDMEVSGFAHGIAGYGVGHNALKNQYLGGYLTYHTDSGFYADTVLQAGRHRSTAVGMGIAGGSSKGSSMLASVEVGQSLALGAGWTIEPQLQLVHQKLSLDDADLVGATVQQQLNKGWAVRAGLRVQGDLTVVTGTLQPYTRLNVWRTASGSDRAHFIGPAAFTDITTPTGGTSTELALGANWQISPTVGVYGELGQMWASGGSAKTKGGPNASLGVKMRW